jgi:hypothetical protein
MLVISCSAMLLEVEVRNFDSVPYIDYLNTGVHVTAEHCRMWPAGLELFRPALQAERHLTL